MGMPMSEARSTPAARLDALAHAGEVAHWTAMLLGWLWLGEQGMRLGWSLASGVLAVALWWAARLLCRGSTWAFQSRPTAMAWCGGLSAVGVWLPQWLASFHASTLNAAPVNLAHTGLLIVALLWGAWSGLIETRSRFSTFQLGPVAWHPVLAATLVGLAWLAPGEVSWTPWPVSALLVVCATVLSARDRATVPRLTGCPGARAELSSLLAPSAMGLMMGSLWMGNVWCAGLGLSNEQMVLGHLGMMAVLPALVAPSWRWIPTHRQPCLSLVLLALGALMLLGQSTVHGVLAMLLPSLAWAVHCSRPRVTMKLSTMTPPWLTRAMALVLGPGLLVWVGLASPMSGPLAMQTALALLGALAGLQALVLSVRETVAHPSWSIP